MLEKFYKLVVRLILLCKGNIFILAIKYKDVIKISKLYSIFWLLDLNKETQLRFNYNFSKRYEVIK